MLNTSLYVYTNRGRENKGNAIQFLKQTTTYIPSSAKSWCRILAPALLMTSSKGHCGRMMLYGIGLEFAWFCWLHKQTATPWKDRFALCRDLEPDLFKLCGAHVSCLCHAALQRSMTRQRATRDKTFLEHRWLHQAGERSSWMLGVGAYCTVTWHLRSTKDGFSRAVEVELDLFSLPKSSWEGL